MKSRMRKRRKTVRELVRVSERGKGKHIIIEVIQLMMVCHLMSLRIISYKSAKSKQELFVGSYRDIDIVLLVVEVVIPKR